MKLLDVPQSRVADAVEGRMTCWVQVIPNIPEGTWFAEDILDHVKLPYRAGETVYLLGPSEQIAAKEWIQAQYEFTILACVPKRLLHLTRPEVIAQGYNNDAFWYTFFKANWNYRHRSGRKWDDNPFVSVTTWERKA